MDYGLNNLVCKCKKISRGIKGLMESGQSVDKTAIIHVPFL